MTVRYDRKPLSRLSQAESGGGLVGVRRGCARGVSQDYPGFANLPYLCDVGKSLQSTPHREDARFTIALAAEVTTQDARLCG